MENLTEDTILGLRDLGLTAVQAKTYIALVRQDSLTVSEISKLSKIQRTDLYDILKGLEEKGLIEREISHPTVYRAIPVEQGLDQLFLTKEKRYFELQKKVAELKHNLGKIDKVPRLKEEANFRIIARKGIIQKIVNAINSSRESIDVIISEARFSKGIIRFHHEIEKSANNGVKCRFITEKPQNGNVFWKLVAEIEANPRCQIRFSTEHPGIIAGIYDQKEVLVFQTPTGDIGGSAALWSNNRSLVTIIGNYFEKLWLTAETQKK